MASSSSIIAANGGISTLSSSPSLTSDVAALERYCRHIFSYLCGPTVAEALQLAACSAAATTPNNAPSPVTAVDAYRKRALVVSVLNQYRFALLEILKALGVEALETFPNTCAVTAAPSSPTITTATASSPSATADALPSNSVRISSQSSFSLPSLISEIDALLPRICFASLSSAEDSEKQQHQPSIPFSFSKSESADIIRHIILNAETTNTIVSNVQLTKPSCHYSSNTNASSPSSEDNAAATAKERLRTRLEKGLKRGREGCDVVGGASSAEAAKVVVTTDNNEKNDTTAPPVRKVSIIEEKEASSTALTRKPTTFVNISNTPSFTHDGPSSAATLLSASASFSASAAAAIAACSYGSLLADYAVGPSTVPANAIPLVIVGKRQDTQSTMIDIVSKAMVTPACHVQVSTSTAAAATASAASAGNNNNTAAPASATSSVILVPPFYQFGTPYRFCQITSQGGGSVAANGGYAPFKFL